MLDKIFEDERVGQLIISDDKIRYPKWGSGFYIRVESPYPGFKGLLEDNEGDYTIPGKVRDFSVKGETLEDALNMVYEKLQEV